MKRIGPQISKARSAVIPLLAVFFAMTNHLAVYASGLQNSQIAKGTENLIKDATTWLMVLAPVAAGLLIIYFCIRRGAADEMDQSAATCCC